MGKQLKIAIYSGVIPSTTFVENLIFQLSKTHKVMLFGTVKGKSTYNSSDIEVIATPTKQIANIIITLCRSLLLLLKHPRLLGVAYKEAKRYKSIYIKWMRFSRFVPVLLYQPDIFHLQWANELDRWVFLKKAYGCKLVVSLLGTHINISPKVDKTLDDMYASCFKHVDAFHSVSKSLVKDILQYSVEDIPVEVIYSTIQASTFKHFSLPKSTAKKSEVLKIVSVGRYHWVKGYNYAIRAIKQLCAKGINVEYSIIAPGLPSEELLFLVEDLGLKKNVIFKSEMPLEDLLSELKLFDLMLLPSISEGIANVVIEAMAIGLPVISTNCGSMSELIVHDNNGWLVPIRDSDRIANQIELFMNVPISKLVKIATNAHTIALEKFHEDMIGEQFNAFYKSIN